MISERLLLEFDFNFWLSSLKKKLLLYSCLNSIIAWNWKHSFGTQSLFITHSPNRTKPISFQIIPFTHFSPYFPQFISSSYEQHFHELPPGLCKLNYELFKLFPLYYALAREHIVTTCLPTIIDRQWRWRWWSNHWMSSWWIRVMCVTQQSSPRSNWIHQLVHISTKPKTKCCSQSEANRWRVFVVNTISSHPVL